MTQKTFQFNPSRAARDLALDVLDELWADGDGIVTFPIDPVKIAEKLGAKVLLADLDSDVAGLLVRREGQEEMSILLNRDDPRNRQRFTCAHEIGHIVRRGSTNGPIGFVEYRNELAGKGTDEEEIFANKFAAELLMPASAVRKLWSENYRVAKMARIFNVSEQAMEIRLTSMSLTST